ncbi:MAG: Cna B-type domain-containing protein [Anaerolineaceae bacterium]|nr:Cna B-type domain-containing protein [Anaerolineaceae bacterium]
MSYLGEDRLKTPEITDFKFTGPYGTKTGISEGGVFSFVSSEGVGTYQIDVTFSSGEKLSFSNAIVQGRNTISWDGNSAAGSYIGSADQTVNGTATLSIMYGENHSVFYDVEKTPGGFKVESLNGTSASAMIYYDNSEKVINGHSFPAFIDGLDKSVNGVNTSSRMACPYGSSDSEAMPGDMVIFDFWSYQKSDDAYTTLFVVDGNTRLDISVVKQWEDFNNRQGIRPNSIFFDLYCGTSRCGNSPYTIKQEDGWQVVLQNIPVYDSNGNTIIYSIKERDIPVSYTSSTSAVSSRNGIAATITNTLVTKSISVTKQYADFENKFGTRPGNLTFDACVGDTAYSSCTANDASRWSCTISGLAVYDASGNAISYTIKERDVPKAYTADTPVVSGVDGIAATVTNTLVTKNLKFTKVWLDDNDQNSMRPQSTTIDVYLGDTMKGSCTASADTSWICTVTGLAVYDATGSPRKYIAKERTVPAGYASSDVNVTVENTTTAEIVNTLETKNISVIKNWTDNENYDSIRPSGIIVVLYKDGIEFRSSLVTSAEHLVSSNIWAYVFRDVPEYNSSGSRAVYTVKEFPVQ